MFENQLAGYYRAACGQGRIHPDKHVVQLIHQGYAGHGLLSCAADRERIDNAYQ